MTPREISGHLFLDDKVRKRADAKLLALINLGTSGDVKKINEQLKRLQRDM